MAYKQMHDLLDRAKAFHCTLSELYEKLEGKATEERVKMLLGYMKRHELNLEECIEVYETDADHAVTDTWLKYEPHVEAEKFIQSLQLSPEMTIDDVVDLALELDTYLVNYYQMIIDAAPSAEIKEVFSSLIKIEEREKKNMSKTGLRMKHM